MELLHELWSPAGILAGAGTVGLIASSLPVTRRWVAWWCLLALWPALWSISDATDDLSRGAVTVSLVWAALLVVLDWQNVREPALNFDRSRSRNLPLQFVLLAGLCLMAQAGDVVTLFLGLQLISVGTRVLGSSGYSAEEPANAVRSPLPWLLLHGFLLLVAVTGTTRIETISEALRMSYVPQDAANYKIAGGGSRMLTLSAILIGSALAGYAVSVPFHFQWWPMRLASQRTDGVGCETHPPLLWLPRAAVLIAWVKLWPATIIATESTAQLLVGVLAAITSIVPLLQARVERSLVRQWMLVAVAQGGWLLLAVAVRAFESTVPAASTARFVVEWNLPAAAQAGWLLLLMDGVALIGLCGVLTYLSRRERPVEFVDDLRGLLRSEPIAAVCASVCLLSLCGLPLLAGFWSRLFLALDAINVRGEWGPPHLLIPHNGLLLLTALLALSTVWSGAIAMRSVGTMLFGVPLSPSRPTGSVSSLFAAVLASMILIGCGLLPGPLLSWLCSPRVEQVAPPQPQRKPAADAQGGTR